MLAIYQGWDEPGFTSFDELQFLGCNDDAPGSQQSRVKVTAPAGFVYVQVGGYRKAGGDLAFKFRAKPGNDSLFFAREADESYLSSYLNTRYATTGSGEPDPCGSIGRTVWYSYYAPQGSRLLASANGSLDTVLAAYVGDASVGSFGELSLLACNDDFGQSSHSQVDVYVGAGQTVYFQVGGYNSAYGDLSFDLEAW